MISIYLSVKTRRWECDRPGVEPTSSGLHVWGQYHSSEKVSCDEWYWNPSLIYRDMCVERGASYAACAAHNTIYMHIYIASYAARPQAGAICPRGAYVSGSRWRVVSIYLSICIYIYLAMLLGLKLELSALEVRIRASIFTSILWYLYISIHMHT